MPPKRPADQADDKAKATAEANAAEGASADPLAKAASPEGSPADATPSSAATETASADAGKTEEPAASSEAASASVEGGATEEAPASSEAPASPADSPESASATAEASAKDESEESSEVVAEAPEQAPVETKSAEVVAEGMAPDEFLAQKGIFQTTDELIRKIRAMPEGAEKEEAIAVFERALAQAPTATEPIIKSGGRMVRVRRFFGSFHDAVFMEDAAKEWGEARGVSDATLEILRSEFPGAEIEVTD